MHGISAYKAYTDNLAGDHKNWHDLTPEEKLAWEAVGNRLTVQDMQLHVKYFSLQMTVANLLDLFKPQDQDDATDVIQAFTGDSDVSSAIPITYGMQKRVDDLRMELLTRKPHTENPLAVAVAALMKIFQRDADHPTSSVVGLTKTVVTRGQLTIMRLPPEEETLVRNVRAWFGDL